MSTLRDFFLMYRPQCIVFLIFMTASLPVLHYYRRRQPNPRFRPTIGEMTMVTLFAAILSAGAGMGIGGLFNERLDFKKLANKPEADFGSPRKPNLKAHRSDAEDDASDTDKLLDEAKDRAMHQSRK